MIDHVLIEALARDCREGLKSLADKSGSAFFGFPERTCGDAANIVGRILKEKAGYVGTYVCGSEHRRLKPSQTHAWYEVGDYIVDITYDQFNDVGLTGWVFRRGQGWHGEFASIERQDGFALPAGWSCYPYDGYQAVIQAFSKRAV
jgi:hypothetical protein